MRGHQRAGRVDDILAGEVDIEVVLLGPISTRKNSRPFSVPASGVSSGTPAPARWAGVSVEALTVTMPTRRPGGKVAWTQGSCIIDEVATGTETAPASSFW